MTNLLKYIQVKLNSQVILYLFAGGVTFMIDAFTFFVLRSVLNVDLRIAIPLSLIFGLVSSLVVNKYVVFSYKNRSPLDILQIFSFIILFIWNTIFSYLVVGLFEENELPSLIGKLVSMLFIVIWNYTIFSRYIFRTRLSSSQNPQDIEA